MLNKLRKSVIASYEFKFISNLSNFRLCSYRLKVQPDNIKIALFFKLEPVWKKNKLVGKRAKKMTKHVQFSLCVFLCFKKAFHF